MYQVNALETSALYTFIELIRANIIPYRTFVKETRKWNLNPLNPISYLSLSRSVNAYLELSERITRLYPKPEFGIKEVRINNKNVKVTQNVILQKTFCDLVHFKKQGNFNQPKMIIVAPMSGHYSTLCRGTVQDALKEFDVYITDWKNVRDIPLSAGSFDMDDFIDYCIDFFIKLPNSHVMAVCQPSVPVTAAVAIMSEEGSSALPKSMTLIGGPIDTRKSPTSVNSYADRREMNWFEKNVITRVPINYKGFMRTVYPGFIQLAGFMAMNIQRHVGEHMKLFSHLIKGDGESSDAHKKFYDEYLAVMDLPAEFYLQTIEIVFKEHSLPEGKLVSNGRDVNLANIKKTALFTIEGELDDITGKGQTEAAIKLCKNIPDKNKRHLFQNGVGHYGLFNGSKFRKLILPNIKDFAYKHEI